MQIKIEEKQTNLSLTRKSTVVIEGVGLQGKAGKDAEFPQNGNTGDVLVKTDSSVAWTNQPTKLNINGGNF